ncbi:MAG TPA: MarR family transcriptional regulator [Acidimicrobiales bacterium]|jgi:DNA-binding MarR family transcriptional regulator|nr:MarR family transcriptional regulator [Acidimicrobiales bacterium]
MNSAPSTIDDVGVIELELLKLVRHLETFGRRGELYRRVDRAGYLALRTLDLLGPVSTNALARALHLDASTVTRQITALESAGFVERRPDPADGRSSILVFTPEGRRTMHSVERERRERMEELVSGWPKAEKATLGRALAKLNVSLIDSVDDLDDDRRHESHPA